MTPAEARKALLEAEVAYLSANGWFATYDIENLLGESVRWSHHDLQKRNISQGHAVNAQKQTEARAAKLARVLRPASDESVDRALENIGVMKRKR